MLKIIALATMLVDHVGLVFFSDHIVFRIIGRLAFPIFAWGIAQGYSRTKNLKKYGQRLLLLGIISQPIFYLVINQEKLNICFSLFLGLASIALYEEILKTKWLNYLLLLSILVFSFIVPIDYGVYGILTILIFHIFRDTPLMIIAQSVLTASFALLSYFSVVQVFAIPAFLAIYLLKRFDFKINRSLQYLFYPLHLLFLYLINIF